MTDGHSHADLTAQSPAAFPLLAGGAIVLWTVLEFALRRGLGPLLADPLGTGLGASAVVLLVAFPVQAGVVAWLGSRVGITPADWAYDVSPRSLAAGLGGVVAFFVAVAATQALYTSVLGLEPAVTGTAFGVADAPTWALVAFFAGNALVVPVAEELAWRGVVQTALDRSYGVAVAVVVTAAAFVLKHVVVDLAASPFRVTSLAVLALIVCGLRVRYGTASSTVAHLGVNAASTAPLLLA